MEDTKPKPIAIGPAAPRPPCDDAERRRKALEQLRRNLLSAAKQVAILESIEDGKEGKAA